MRLLLSLATALLCSTLAAHADTYELFDLNANLSNGATITGTVNLDLSSTISYDTFNSTASLVYTLGTTSIPITGPNDLFGYTAVPPNVEIGFPFDGGERFILGLPTSGINSLSGFSGGLCTGDCALNSAITTGLTPIWTVTSGTFLPATTPEPGSFLLLGTGLLGVIGTLRRRRET